MPTYLNNIDAKKHPQPCVLSLCNQSKLNSSNAFVIIEKKAIPQSSLLKVVDVCYKAHYVLDCTYHLPATMPWSVDIIGEMCLRAAKRQYFSFARRSGIFKIFPKMILFVPKTVFAFSFLPTKFNQKRQHPVFMLKRNLLSFYFIFLQIASS